MRLRRDPEDDLLHTPDADPNYNESRYYNFFDAAADLGGWIRMGNRPNEGYAEMTVCLYLPDGSVGFMFQRPEITGHAAHDAGGLRFEVVAPYEEHRVTYDGRVCVLAEPRAMADPGTAFRANPHEPCSVELRVTAVAEASGGEPEYEEGEEPPAGALHSFARGHTEQQMAVAGTVRVGDRSFTLTDGFGLRDHSWGPRVWQSIWWYRWLTASFGSFGIAATVRGREGDDRRTVNGYVFDRDRYGDGRVVPVRALDLTTDYDDDWYVLANRAVVTTDDHTYDLVGEVRSAIPLRNRRNGLVTRLTESMTHWTCGDAHGAGLSEYLDQIVDDLPVGTRVGI